MRSASVFASCSLVVVSFVIACTGGPGSADQGGDTGDQNGSIMKDTASSGAVAIDTTSGAPNRQDTTVSTSSGGTRNPPADIKASDYDQSCNVDTDCIAIDQGTVCTVCTCNNAAIASKDATKYQSDRTTRFAQCDPSSFAGGVACSPCNATQRASCDTNSKKCVFR